MNALTVANARYEAEIVPRGRAKAAERDSESERIRAAAEGASGLTMVVVLHDLCGQPDLIEVDDALLRRAVELAEVHTLRGYDAIRLAGVERVAEDETILMAGDRDLLAAGQYVALSFTDTSASHYNK